MKHLKFILFIFVVIFSACSNSDKSTSNHESTSAQEKDSTDKIFNSEKVAEFLSNFEEMDESFGFNAAGCLNDITKGNKIQDDFLDIFVNDEDKNSENNYFYAGKYQPEDKDFWIIIIAEEPKNEDNPATLYELHTISEQKGIIASVSFAQPKYLEDDNFYELAGKYEYMQIKTKASFYSPDFLDFYAPAIQNYTEYKIDDNGAINVTHPEEELQLDKYLIAFLDFCKSETFTKNFSDLEERQNLHEYIFGFYDYGGIEIIEPSTSNHIKFNLTNMSDQSDIIIFDELNIDDNYVLYAFSRNSSNADENWQTAAGSSWFSIVKYDIKNKEWNIYDADLGETVVSKYVNGACEYNPETQTLTIYEIIDTGKYGDVVSLGNVDIEYQWKNDKFVENSTVDNYKINATFTRFDLSNYYIFTTKNGNEFSFKELPENCEYELVFQGPEMPEGLPNQELVGKEFEITYHEGGTYSNDIKFYNIDKIKLLN